MATDRQRNHVIQWSRTIAEQRSAHQSVVTGPLFVIRSQIFETAATVKLEPGRLSFAGGGVQIVNCRLLEFDGKTAARCDAWYRGLLWDMQGEWCNPRRNWNNPRVIERKLPKWKKKDPQHRHLPLLGKPFLR
jgi:hypothetical protein